MYVYFDFVPRKNKSCIWSWSHDIEISIIYDLESFLSLRSDFQLNTFSFFTLPGSNTAQDNVIAFILFLTSSQ